MITIEEAKALPQAIINHACNYLSIDETSIRIVFAPKVEPLYGVPQYATVLNDDTIVIAEDFLALCCEKGFTMVRDELYRRLRFIAKRREANGNLDWSMAMYDAISFSTALLLLDGNQLPCPNEIDAEAFFMVLYIFSQMNLVWSVQCLKCLRLLILVHIFIRYDCLNLVAKAYYQNTNH